MVTSLSLGIFLETQFENNSRHIEERDNKGTCELQAGEPMPEQQRVSCEGIYELNVCQ